MGEQFSLVRENSKKYFKAPHRVNKADFNGRSLYKSNFLEVKTDAQAEGQLRELMNQRDVISVFQHPEKIRINANFYQSTYKTGYRAQ